MNLLLFRPSELTEQNLIEIQDDRAAHLLNVIDVSEGQEIRAGLVNGGVGIAKVVTISGPRVLLEWRSTSHPPSAIDCVLILALPRPKMIKRVLQHVASLGVKEIHLINSWKVEKSFWESPVLLNQRLEAELLAGLSQAGDTVLPKVYQHRLFKPFAQDILPSVCKDRLGLVAHPYTAERCPVDIRQPSVLTLGPEGGFTEFEVDLLQDAGMLPVSIGERILRVETAVPVLLSRLYPA